MKTVICPNCGASATNLKNCEYCGSLLVRFVDNNIVIDNSKYGSKATVFNGLKESLKRNLEEQERTYGRNHVHTNIHCSSIGLELEVTNPKAQTEVIVPNVYFEGNKSTLRVSPTYQNNTDEQSLVICIRFYKITDKTYLKFDQFGEFEPFNNENERKHNCFKNLDIYKLFTFQEDELVICSKIGLGHKCGIVYQYYLNFGQDVEGAANIITQYLQNSASIVSIERCLLQYEHKSLTDEEYEIMLKEILSKSKRGKWLALIVFSLPAVIGWWLVNNFDTFDQIFMRLCSLVGGVAIILVSLWTIYFFFTKSAE